MVVLIAGCQGIVGIEDHVFEASVNVSGVRRLLQRRDVRLPNPERGVLEPGHLPRRVRAPTSRLTQRVCRRQLDRVPQALRNLAQNSEAAFNCPRAGPGGGGKCGTNCASYCSLIMAVCPDQGKLFTDCENQCAAFRTVGTFDVVANHEGDTLECRLVHVSSATVEPDTHCSHTGVFPTAFCMDNPTVAPIATISAGSRWPCARATWPSTNRSRNARRSARRCPRAPTAICLRTPSAVASTIPTTPYSTRRITVRTPALAATPIAVPTPRMTMGTALVLHLAPAGVRDGLRRDIPAGQAACQKDCSTKLDALGAKRDSRYKVSAGQMGGNTMACRLLHASRALSDPNECPSALGGGVCAP